MVDGRTYWSGPPVDAAAPPSPTFDVVQGYDEVVMSYSESRDVLFTDVVNENPMREQVPFLHAVLLDGRLIGHWRPVARGKTVALEASFYRPLAPEEQDALAAAVSRYGRFLEQPVALATA